MNFDSLSQQLDEPFRERVRCLRDGKFAGDAVIYWMVSAMRVDENPALDVAREFAVRLNKPLLIYQGLSEDYRYASDRHHTFILEGARDVQQQCKQAGLTYALHVANANDRQPHLTSLANQAAVIVTEDMPVDPQRTFLRALLRKSDCAAVAVDTACVVPMQLVEKLYTRAFAFRDKTAGLYAERLTRPWPETAATPAAYSIEALPFKPVDLEQQDIADMVARCNIDHSVGPVADTAGGSLSGYQRFESFVKNGLSKYAARRNDPRSNGSSRMSAYLHYGMVSPMKIARQAAARGTKGAEKFLDELLIWRELAWNFCFHHPRHDRFSALPDWAQDTLNQHASDQRPQTFSWEQLARAQTGDPIWDAAQTSLLLNGELHNNVRMTWGKAILNWTRSPREALSMLIDLNHRYALDGRDPASYGGLLWCLGQFDRPFSPEESISGTVRPRSTTAHAKRLDVTSWRSQINDGSLNPASRVAVVGAGIAGLAAARTLADHGVDVCVFEKSRGLGGRMATRRHEDVPTWDHGAQHFTARNRDFKRHVESWLQQGIVAQWPSLQQTIAVFENGKRQPDADTGERFVGTPSQKSVCRHLAKGLKIDLGIRVENIERAEEEGWQLRDAQKSDRGTFSHVILAVPADQATVLLSTSRAVASSMINSIAGMKMQPCWAVMASFEQPLTDQWVGAFINHSPVSWVARNNTKPGRRDNEEYVVIHASPKWTNEHLEDTADSVAHELVDAMFSATRLAGQTPSFTTAHRWRYSAGRPEDSAPVERCFANEDSSVIACGDWSAGNRVEGGWLGGVAAAGRVLSALKRTSRHRSSESNTIQRDLF